MKYNFRPLMMGKRYQMQIVKDILYLCIRCCCKFDLLDTVHPHCILKLHIKRNNINPAAVPISIFKFQINNGSLMIHIQIRWIGLKHTNTFPVR